MANRPFSNPTYYMTLCLPHKFCTSYSFQMLFGICSPSKNIGKQSVLWEIHIEMVNIIAKVPIDLCFILTSIVSYLM